MLIILKALFLFTIIFFVIPIVFFILIGTIGGFFSLEIDKDSWFARTEIKWIKKIVHKFFA